MAAGACSVSGNVLTAIFPIFLWFSAVAIVASLQLPRQQHRHQQPPPATPPPHHVASSRRDVFRSVALLGSAAVVTQSLLTPRSARAAPPIAVIAEELGYFPVRSPKTGDVAYVPKRVSRPSSDQAVELARRLQEKGVTMYGAFWCPHCARQKELFGREAWAMVPYVECAPRGYGYQGGTACRKIDGYPTFRDKSGKIQVSGERPLEVLAQEVGFTGFDPSLETDDVPMIGSSCKIR